MTGLRTEFEEVKLIYRNKTRATDRPKLSSAQKVYDVLLDSWDLGQIELLEEFKIIMVDRATRLMSIAQLSKGGLSGTVADPKLAFMIALKRRANSIILAHNHPSGNIKPSAADLRLTKRFVEAGRFLELPILDHLIITEHEYYSMANEGVL